MIVIADSGSTKTQWVLIDGKQVISDLTTKGFNPFYYGADDLVNTLFEELNNNIDADVVDKVFFYGSGCSNDSNCSMVKNSLQLFFKKAIIYTEHDLTGAAVALLKDSKGIACILGTGSNSCMWDGQKVTHQLPSLGWMLADEGSGTYLGKLLLQSILYGEDNPELTKKFYKKFDLDFDATLHKIYSEPNPNKFFASLSRFAADNLNYPGCKEVVKISFRHFIEKQVSKYPDYQNQTVSFTGSVSYVFQDILKEVLKEYNITLGTIMKNPMEGMIEYHSK